MFLVSLRAGISLPLPYFSCPVPAGFPSPADDWLECPLDINELLISRPAATYLLRVAGDSMTPTLEDGDLLVVDRSVNPRPGQIVVAAVAGDLTVKRLGRGRLEADNPAHPPIILQEDEELVIWGVVCHVIRSFSSARGR